MDKKIKIVTQVEKYPTTYWGSRTGWKYKSVTFHYVLVDNVEVQKHKSSDVSLRDLRKSVTKEYGEYGYSHVGSIIIKD